MAARGSEAPPLKRARSRKGLRRQLPSHPLPGAGPQATLRSPRPTAAKEPNLAGGAPTSMSIGRSTVAWTMCRSARGCGGRDSPPSVRKGGSSAASGRRSSRCTTYPAVGGGLVAGADRPSGALVRALRYVLAAAHTASLVNACVTPIERFVEYSGPLGATPTYGLLRAVMSSPTLPRHLAIKAQMSVLGSGRGKFGWKRQEGTRRNAEHASLWLSVVCRHAFSPTSHKVDHEVHKKYWELMQPVFGESLRHVWENLPDCGVRAATFYRSHSPVLEMFADAKDLDTIFTSENINESAGVETQRVSAGSSSGASFFKAELLKVSGPSCSARWTAP